MFVLLYFLCVNGNKKHWRHFDQKLGCVQLTVSFQTCSRFSLNKAAEQSVFFVGAQMKQQPMCRNSCFVLVHRKRWILTAVHHMWL